MELAAIVPSLPAAPCTVIVSPALRSPTRTGDDFVTFEVGVVDDLHRRPVARRDVDVRAVDELDLTGRAVARRRRRRAVRAAGRPLRTGRAGDATGRAIRTGEATAPPPAPLKPPFLANAARPAGSPVAAGSLCFSIWMPATNPAPAITSAANTTVHAVTMRREARVGRSSASSTSSRNRTSVSSRGCVGVGRRRVSGVGRDDVTHSEAPRWVGAMPLGWRGRCRRTGRPSPLPRRRGRPSRAARPA